MALQGALFDMDGLLLDTERLGMGVFISILADWGMSAVDAEALYRGCVGKSLERGQQEILKAVPGADVGLIDQRWHEGLDAAFAQAIRLRPTVRETLARLGASGLPMAVVTTTKTHRAGHHLEQAGLLYHLVDVIGRDRVDRPKPAPDPYLMGAAALGLLPDACAAFEDSDTGTLAAVAAGCAVWQIPDLRPADMPLPKLGQHPADDLASAVTAAGF